MDYTEKKKNNEILSWLEKNLDEKRYQHSIGCAECAAELAEKYGEDKERTYLAGLLHDCAKCFKKEKMIEIANEMGIDQEEISNFKVLHAPVSAYVAKEEFGINDEEILSSIRWHTLGKMNMTTFEKIIFVADKIEHKTREADHRQKITPVLEGEDGLNQAMLVCYKETIKSLLRRNLKICQATIDIYNSMLG